MKQNDIKFLISIIKKYDLFSMFNSKEEFDEWVNSLSKKAINNLKKLNLKPEEITFHKNFLINKDLLECDDYLNRLDLISKVKCNDTWRYNNLVNPSFLKSKYYYYDMELLSKNMNIQLLDIIINSAFINSPYHKEDARYIIDSMKDNVKLPDIPSLLDKEEDKKHVDERDKKYMAEVLSNLASNEDSIKSQHHEADMIIISKTDLSKITRTTKNCSVVDILEYYATNKDALNDDYHIENMMLLSNAKETLIPLYGAMVCPEIVKHKNYRKIINILSLSKDLLSAVASYYYLISTIGNSSVGHYDNLIFNNVTESDFPGLLFAEQHYLRSGFPKTNLIPTDTDEYLNDLKVLTQSGECALFLGLLLVNSNFVNSKYKKKDIELLLSIQDKKAISDLYIVMNSSNSLNSDHHLEDLEIIKNSINHEYIRKLLTDLAKSEVSLNSPYHKYDMEFVANLSKVDESEEEKYKIITERVNRVRDYITSQDAVDDVNHKETLEELVRGEDVSKKALINYLSELENNPSLFNEKDESRLLTKVKNIFTKK